jgi:hypothetical protein
MKDGCWNKVKFFITNASDVIRRNLPGAAQAIRAPTGKKYRYVVTVWPDNFIYEEGNKLFEQKYLIDDST